MFCAGLKRANRIRLYLQISKDQTLKSLILKAKDLHYIVNYRQSFSLLLFYDFAQF